LAGVFSEGVIVKEKKTGKAAGVIEKKTVRGQLSSATPKSPIRRSGLRSEHPSFKALMDAAAEAIVVFDGEGKIFYGNPAAERLFGYRGKELAGVPLDWIIPERYRDEYREALEKFRKKRRLRPLQRSFESEIIQKNGKEIPIAASVATTQMDGGWYFIAIARDITSLRAAQRSVGDHVARYQLIYENQKDGILLVDMETQQFLEVNQAATQMYGYTKEEMLGMRIVDFFSEEDRGGPGFSAESAAKLNIFKHKKKDGSVFPAEITGCALTWRNRDIFCAIVKDMSKRAELQG
jgi:PAS domain S-box-containing protein